MKQFRALLRQPELDLPLLALHIARILSYPDLQPQNYIQRIEALANDAEATTVSIGSEAARVEKLAQYLYHDASLRGDTLNYADPRNSFLNDVLSRGLGIPISLSIIYVAVAQELGMHAYGISLPGHFIVGIGNNNEATYVDPFSGKRLSGSDCARLVRETTGFTGSFKTEWLRPANKRDVLLRILNNLRLAYTREEMWEQALTTLALIELISPALSTTSRDQALIAFAQNDYFNASRKLEDFVRQNPEGIDANTLKLAIAPALEKWAQSN